VVTYTKHCKIRIKQRNLKKSYIEQTVLKPDKTIDSFGKRKLAQKKLFDKTLEVVFIQENNDFIIITAYWLTEVKE